MSGIQDKGSAIWFNRVEQLATNKALGLSLGEKGELSNTEAHVIKTVRAKIAEYMAKGRRKG